MKNRSQRLIFFLVVWLTMFSCISARSQNFYVAGIKTGFSQLKYPGASTKQVFSGFSFSLAELAQAAPSIICFSGPLTKEPEEVFPYFMMYQYDGLNGQPGGIYVQPANLYYLQSGFFCKREWELEKTTHIPFRFRLGSLADCNALEGKH